MNGKKEFLNGVRVLGIDKLVSDNHLKQLQAEEDAYQEQNKGGFRRIFPDESGDSSDLLKIHN